jgi:hypothetical protein
MDQEVKLPLYAKITIMLVELIAIIQRGYWNM